MKIALSRRIDYALAASALRAFARLAGPRLRALWRPCGTPLKKTLLLAALLSGVALAAKPLEPKLLDSLKSALKGWELEYADVDAKVDAGGGFKGYRIVFSRRYDADLARNVVSSSKPRFNHVDLVLVPKAKGFDPLDAKSEIRWSQAQEEYFVTPRWLGEASGYEWFCRANVSILDLLRDKMKLKGGEAEYAILASALTADDPEHISEKYAVERLKPFGKDAIPAIVAAVLAISEKGGVPRAPMYALRSISCPEADAILIKYFNTPDKNLSLAARDALCIAPYVEAAKTAYLTMLKERVRVSDAAEACRLFGLTADSEKALNSIIASPDDLAGFVEAVVARAAIKAGKIDKTPFEIAEKIVDAAAHSGEVPGTPKTITLNEEAKAAKAKLHEEDMRRLKPLESKLVEYPDKDLAFAAALWLAMFNATDSAPSFSARVNASGMRIMKKLPSQNVEPYLSRLSKRLGNKEEAKNVVKIHRRLASPTIEMNVSEMPVLSGEQSQKPVMKPEKGAAR